MKYLKELSYQDSKKEYLFFTKIGKDINGFENPYYGYSYQAFYHDIARRINNAKGINLEEGHVPDTYFFLWKNNIIIGLFKVRHYLNDHLRNGSGHIGYLVLEDFQGKGYGSLGLKLAIKKLLKMKDFKENEIYLSCDRTNEASLKVMLHNGGYIHHSDDNEHYVRIKIKD